MLLDTNNHSSRKKEKIVTYINPARGNLEEKVIGKGTGNLYLSYNAEHSINQIIFPSLCKCLKLIDFFRLPLRKRI